VTRSRDAARDFAVSRKIDRWIWPRGLSDLGGLYQATLVMLPDWGLHPASADLAEYFAARLRMAQVSH